MNQEELRKLLADNTVGDRLIMPDAYLRGVTLIDIDLTYANLRCANLAEVYMAGTNLSHADLTGADLRFAYLRGSKLAHANLTGANLTGANLVWADLNDVVYDYTTIGISLACPETGAFTMFKKCNEAVVTLYVPEDAKRSSATTRKIRVSKAMPIAHSRGETHFQSDYDPDFWYEIGVMAEVPYFDEDRWNECSRGIHGFLTRHEAEMWHVF